MSLPLSELELRFGSVDQRTGDKFLSGQLDQAINVIQQEDGVWEKRNGYERMNRTANSGGSITSGLHLSRASGKLVHVDNTRVMIRDDVAGNWHREANRTPAFMTYDPVMQRSAFSPNVTVDANGNRWYFASSNTYVAAGLSSGLREYFPTYRVVDSAGQEVVAETQFNAIAAAGGRAVVIGTNVWYFFIASDGTQIRVAKFNALSPTASPTVSVYYSVFDSSGLIRNLDVILTSGGAALVAAWGTKLNGASNAAVVASYLNTATSLPTSNMHLVLPSSFAARSAGGLVRNGNSLHPNYRLVVATNGVGNDTVEMVNIAAASISHLATIVSGLGTLSIYDQICAMYDPTQAGTIMLHGYMPTDATPRPYDGRVELYVRTDGGSISAGGLILARHAWVAGQMFMHSGKAYAVLGVDDVYSHPRDAALSSQRFYMVFDYWEQRPIARCMYEEGGGQVGHGVFGATQGGSYVSETLLSGSTAKLLVNACRDGLNDYYAAELSIDMNPALGHPIPVGDDCYIPGGMPIMVTGDGACDPAPWLFPPYITTTLVNDGLDGRYTGTVTSCASYVIVLPDGREIESQPSEFKTDTAATQFVRMTVPTINMETDSPFYKVYLISRLFVRAQCTLPNGTTIFQQRQIPNANNASTVTIDLRDPQVGKTLYTEGGVIENAPCPPFKFGCVWNDRLFVSGAAERGMVYCTKPIRQGQRQAPAFYDDGKFSCGPVDVLALAPVDQNLMAIFCSDGIRYITGRGMDEVGAGEPFAPVKLAIEDTVSATAGSRSVISTPFGVMYASRGDGGIYLLDFSLNRIFIGRGVYEHRAATVVDAEHNPVTQRVMFELSNGKTMVFSYAFKPPVAQDPADQYGIWSVFEYGSAFTPVGSTIVGNKHCVLDNTGFVWREVDGQAFDLTSSFFGMKMRLPLNLSGVAGYNRLVAGTFIGTWLGQHRVQITITTDGTASTPKVADLTSSTHTWDFKPVRTKAQQHTLLIEELQYLSNLNRGFKWEGLGLEVQKLRGHKRPARRIT